jgi:hypothetical protein
METIFMAETEEREILSTTKKIELKRSGNSDMLRLPASWRDAFPQLSGPRIIFEAHVERDLDGRIFLVFQKERPNSEVKKQP